MRLILDPATDKVATCEVLRRTPPMPALDPPLIRPLIRP